MNSWKAEVRRVRRDKIRRKKMQMREKVGKSRNTLFLQWFVAPQGRKVGSLKRRVRSQLARWEMKNCTPLWREAHFQVKMYKTPQLRTTFGSCDVEKVHAVVARSTFPSQNVQNTHNIAFSVCGEVMAVASRDKTVKVWGMQEKKLIGVFKGHNSEITKLVFSPIEMKVLSGGMDGCVKMWKLPIEGKRDRIEYSCTGKFKAKEIENRVLVQNNLNEELFSFER